MGFMDKAKKYAEQAQTKLDEVQKQFNETQSAQRQQPSGGATVEYDQHGRKVVPEGGAPATPAPDDTAPPQGDPLVSTPPTVPAADAAPVPPTPDPERPHGDPLADAAPKPPKPPSGGGMTSGDPLAG